jgi:2-polyprenyl-3-methyl-5-hydroxy-6-metoxy-1,4-benzoquinol methylase
VRVHAVNGPQDPRLSVTVAYDAIAAEYDAQVRGDDWMRRALHAHYARVFRAGQRVLDVGCGTGIDAVALARSGVRVVGVDGSAAMVARLHAKIAREGVADRVQAHVLRIEDLGSLAEPPFDGLISAFAGLSSLPDLAGFARDAARLVRPGGRVVLHMLNRFSLWEWLGYIARGNWPAARYVGTQQTRAFVIGGEAVQHSLYFSDEAYHRFFRQDFALRGAYGLGALRPPHTVRRVPMPIVARLERLDVRLGGLPLLRNAGRFFVLDLQRLGGSHERQSITAAP